MKQLARACSCKLEEVLLAAARIRELNPNREADMGMRAMINILYQI